MKTRLIVKLLAAILALISVLPAKGDSFVHSPESRAPVWSSSSPYQRDIDMTFNVSPVSPGPTGIPGATYAGILDSAYKRLDEVAFTGSTQWFPAGTIGFTAGTIGVINPGSGVLTGTATVRLGNRTGGQSLYLWVEMLYFAGIGTSAGVSVVSPGGAYSVTTLGAEIGGVSYPTGWHEPVAPMNGAGISRFVCEYQITPAPTDGELLLSFSAAHGTFCSQANVLELHVATETELPPPPRLQAPTWLGGGGFRLTVVGQPGASYEIQSSETLTNWTTLGTLSIPQGTNSFTDPTAAANRPRFYRARLLQ